jgi:hypothetical protein
MAEETLKKSKFTYHLLDVDDKCLILRIDFNVGFTNACEIIAIFSPTKKNYAEKVVKDLNKGVIA